MKREKKIELIREALEEGEGDEEAYFAIRMTLDLYENPDTTWGDKQKFWSAINTLVIHYMPELY